MKYNYDHISNVEIDRAIDTWVHGERNRAIMKRRLIDMICYEPLAEEFGVSVRHVQNVVYKNSEIIFKHIDQERREKCMNCACYKPEFA